MVRNSYHLHILLWNPGPPRGEDHSAVANHICGHCHTICLQVGAGIANHPTLHHRFHVVTGCHCCPTRTRVSVTLRGNRSWHLQHIMPYGLLRGYDDVMEQIATNISTVSGNIFSDSWTEANGVNLSEVSTGMTRFQILRTRPPKGPSVFVGDPHRSKI